MSGPCKEDLCPKRALEEGNDREYSYPEYCSLGMLPSAGSIHLHHLRPTAAPVRLRVPIRQRLPHLDCLIEKAASQQAHRGTKAW